MRNANTVYTKFANFTWLYFPHFNNNLRPNFASLLILRCSFQLWNGFTISSSCLDLLVQIYGNYITESTCFGQAGFKLILNFDVAGLKTVIGELPPASSSLAANIAKRITGRLTAAVLKVINNNFNKIQNGYNFQAIQFVSHDCIFAVEC